MYLKIVRYGLKEVWKRIVISGESGWWLGVERLGLGILVWKEMVGGEVERIEGV